MGRGVHNMKGVTLDWLGLYYTRGFLVYTHISNQVHNKQHILSFNGKPENCNQMIAFKNQFGCHLSKEI